MERPTYSPDQFRSLLRDPHFLPTHADVLSAFAPFQKPDSPINDEWRTLCLERRGVDGNWLFLDLLTRDYIEAFGDYLLERKRHFAVSSEAPVTILEVGAGDARLAHFLKRQLHEHSVRYIATDSGENEYTPAFALEPVTQMDFRKALIVFKPTIVICSWMPVNRDWTADFRTTQSVREYILIGEPDTGITGLSWETWGWLQGDDQRSAETPPYERDGFTRVELDSISKYQMCFVDESAKTAFKSKTTSFRRA